MFGLSALRCRVRGAGLEYILVEVQGGTLRNAMGSYSGLPFWALAKKLILSPNGRDLEYLGWLPCYGTLSEFA